MGSIAAHLARSRLPFQAPYLGDLVGRSRRRYSGQHGVVEREPGRSTAPTVALATALAALTHEAFLLVGLAAALLPPKAPGAHPRRRLAEAVLGHLAGAGVALAVRFLGQPQVWAAGNPLGTLWPATKRGLRAAFLLADLSPLVTLPSGPRAVGVACLLVLGAALGAAISAARRRPWARMLGFGLLLGGSVTAAQAYAASLGGAVADRAAFGLVLAAAIALAPAADLMVATLAQRLDRGRRLIAWAGGAALVVAVLPLTWSGGLTYRSDEALARFLVTSNPDDPAGLARAGLILAIEGNVETAEKHCRTSVGWPTGASDAELCLAELAERRGDDDEALARIRREVDRMPARALARKLLWRLLGKQARHAEMRAWIERLQPSFGNEPDLVAASQYLQGPAIRTTSQPLGSMRR